MSNWFKGLVVVVACFLTYHFTDSRWQAKWAKHLAQDAQERLDFEQAQRGIEHAYIQDREALQLDLQARVGVLHSSIADSAEQLNSLQHQLDTTRSALQSASKAAGTAGVNQGAAKAALVLSDMYSASINELQRVAGTADEWYEALDGCNRFYTTVKSRQQP